MTNFTPSIERITKNHIDKWKSLRGSQDIFMLNKELAFDIATSILMGNSLSNEEKKIYLDLFSTWMDGFFSLIPFNIPFLSFGKSMKARKELLAAIEKEIKKRETVLKSKTEEQDFKCALDILLNFKDEEGNSLTLDQLKDQSLIQLFAGHDTTTAGMGSICYCLDKYPEVHTKLKQEIQSTCPSGVPLQFTTIKSMKFLDCFIKEVLRFIPPVGAISKEVIQSFEYEGFTIPANWGIMFSIYTNHFDPNVWQSPDEFNPSRFETAKPHAFTTFGEGPRMVKSI